MEPTTKCNKCDEIRLLAPLIRCRTVNCPTVINEAMVYYVNVASGWTYCPPCHHASAWRNVGVEQVDKNNNDKTDNANSESLRKLTKKDFSRRINKAIYQEDVVQCLTCGKSFLKICVKFTDVESIGSYRCEECCSGRDANGLRNNPFLNFAKIEHMTSTKLSRFVEWRINRMLPINAKRVHVRVMSCQDKVHRLSNTLGQFLKPSSIPQELPFVSRILACFEEEEDGDSAMFFTVYFQEYGAHCPQPNQNSIYISILDSAQIFEPSNFRRKVNHCVLLSYFEFMKNEGFQRIFYWICPPRRQGIEYIFYRRPKTQKNLDLKHLTMWYHQLMTMAQGIGIVEEFKSLADFVPDDRFSFFENFPLFEGDHWPSAVEEIISDVKKGVYTKTKTPPKKKKKGTITKPSSDTENKSQTLDEQVFEVLKTKQQKHLFQCMQFAGSNNDQRRNNWLSEGGKGGPRIFCPLFDRRDDLTAFFQKKSLEFQDLRKATYSTKGLFMRLLLQTTKIACGNCSRPITSNGYYCHLCKLNFCLACVGVGGHHREHQDHLEKIMPLFHRSVWKVRSGDLRIKLLRITNTESNQAKILLLADHINKQTCGFYCNICRRAWDQSGYLDSAIDTQLNR